jgi:hypothetical protein
VRLSRAALAAALIASAAAFVAAGDVVVLKGGTVIALKLPVVRRGSTAYLTRADGTLLSVPVSEIDRDATAAANQAPPAAAPKQATAASTPADAAKAKDGQKAKVRITDADVSHPLDLSAGAPEEKDKKAQGAGTGNARVEVADYTREKAGAVLVVKGTLRNPGQSPAENIHMAVSALDEKGQPIEGGNATLSKGTLDPGSTVDFSVSLNVGEKTVSSLRFMPVWSPPKPPPAPAAAQPAPGGAAGQGGSNPNRPPAPAPTPYGLGSTYSAPAPSASTEIPSDSHSGYLPSVSSPDNQPKPPSR